MSARMMMPRTDGEDEAGGADGGQRQELAVPADVRERVRDADHDHDRMERRVDPARPAASEQVVPSVDPRVRESSPADGARAPGAPVGLLPGREARELWHAARGQAPGDREVGPEDGERQRRHERVLADAQVVLLLEHDALAAAHVRAISETLGCLV
jgi:hypothetical protein